MKIEIKQQKLIEILDYLYVDGLYPFSIITTKDGKLISAQKEKDGFGFRFAMFDKEYFHDITEEQESVKIDVEKIKKFASLRKPDAIITLEYPVKKKLQVSGEGLKDNLSVPELDDKEIMIKLPFKIKDGMPYLRGGKVALDTHVTLSLGSLKKINDIATAHGTEFFRFVVGKDKKLKVRIGEIHALEDFSEYEPEGSKVFKANGELEVTMTKGIKEISKTFTRDIEVYLRTNMAGWFSEISQSHKFGVLVSPMQKKEE